MMPEWISVKDRLPEYGERILACGHRGGIFCCKYLSYSERNGGFGKMDQASTHRHFANWMPLPEAPKTDGGKD